MIYGSKIITWLIITFLIAVSLAISITFIVTRASEADALRQMLWRGAIEERLSRTFTTVSDFPGKTGKDLLYLRTLTQEKDFSNFLAHAESYRELYVFDRNGACAMHIGRVERGVRGGGCGSVGAEITKAAERSAALANAQAYLSPLVLVEGVSTLVSGTPTGSGVVVAVIDAEIFLEEVRRLSRLDESVYLLESDGSYLANPDHAKEKLLGGNTTFYQDFRDVPADILADASIKRFETDKAVFTFWRMYPTESNFALYEGANKIFGPEREHQYFWVMAAVSEKSHIPQSGSSNMPAFLILFLTHVAVVALLYFFMVHEVSPFHNRRE